MKLVAFLRLVRIHNCLIAGIAVWIGGYLSGITGNNLKLYLASLAGALVCGAGNALNDFMDIESDQISHPGRPLASGQLPLYAAILAAIVMNLAAVVLVVPVGWAVTGLVVITVFLLFLYNFKLKKIPVTGNLIVSFLGGLTFIVGGLAVQPENIFVIPGPVIPAMFAFLFHLGRELLKDSADCRGDLAAEYKTLPMIISPAMVLIIITIIYLLLIMLTLVPLVYKWYRPAYGYIAILLVDIPLLIILGFLRGSRSERKYQLAGGWLKWLMIFGLMAFFLGESKIS
nr:geranylgeranylglycerol-phosphate geranylgeranyltransferase [candidate division Zixibacteria bacterium]